ncbi:Golgi pH regulator B [Hypsizygus marmoreus]|uniref:Golgi pH regulator B n=1 Tax=Hypsizygus marmoreus TaxID=39966 RepID=A0A369J6M3_HYPMA|nr:Golgi pH regulator B [Hypsizygus marmoreus]
MLNMLFLEFSALVGLRILAFLGCRKYLLRSLYSDLQTLSLDTTDPLTPDLPQSPSPSESGIQLDSLPAPATQTKVTKMLPNDSSYLHSTVSRSVFSLVFAESCMMFFVLMLQGIDVFLPRTRLLSWQFSLIFLMLIILVIVPLSISVLLAVGSRPSGMTTTRHHLLGPRVCLGLLSVALYLFALSKIPLPHALSSTGTFTAALSRLIVLGTIILGLLSGYGAISNSWAFIPWVSPDRGEPTDQDVATAEYALQSIRNDLNERTAAAERRSALPTTEGSNWFSRVVPNFRGSGDGSSSELQGLQALEYQMSRKLEALRARRDAARYARTLRGRILGIGARVFAFYCVFRIISSTINLIVPSRRPTFPSAQPSGPSYPDLLADLLALVSPYPLNFDDVVSFSRQLSLALVGLIILTSVRRVLLGVTRALRVTSRNLGASLMMLILAQLMGIYLLSTIVQLRNSFPPPPHSPSSGETPNLFSTIPAFEVFGALFDWSFVLAAAASAFVRWGHERVNGVEDV